MLTKFYMAQIQLEKTLENYFRKDRRVITVYLFGSHVLKKTRKDSDLDIALLLQRECPRAIYADLILKYTCDLIKILKKDFIDILILNSSGPIVRHQVYKKGKLIFCRDKRQTMRYKDLSIAEYLDFLPFRLRAEEIVVRRILNGGRSG